VTVPPTGSGQVYPPVVALVQILDLLLTTFPRTAEDADRRRAGITKAVDQLSQVGVDGESLIRYGMAQRASLGVFIAVASQDARSMNVYIDAAIWRDVLKVAPPSKDVLELTDEDIDALAASYVHLPTILDRWVRNAPFQDIIDFTAPSADALSLYALAAGANDDVAAGYRWLWERSTVDSLDQWSFESLLLEYRWQNRLGVRMFRDEALQSEGPDSALLNEQIAFRTAVPRESAESDDDALFWRLQSQAVRFLVDERFTEAAALFEFHHRLYPRDARAINNLGFCHLPRDPAQALHYLQRAERAGYIPTAFNVYNQCCCLHSLGRSGEALDRAEAYWQRQRDDSAQVGYLWVRSSSGWVLKPDLNPQEELVSLALEIADGLGRNDRAEKWSARLAGLRVEGEAA
jgi:hypothetical protein